MGGDSLKQIKFSLQTAVHLVHICAGKTAHVYKQDQQHNKQRQIFNPHNRQNSA